MSRRFRGVRWFALVALVAGVVAVPSALANEPQQIESARSGLWFVELNGKPAAAGGSVAANKAEKAAFRSEAGKAKVSFTERYAFDTLWNGLSISTKADAATLKDIKGVKEVHALQTASIPPTETVSPDLATAIQMTGADIAQSSLGFDGTGVKVAVMDTGLDLDHPDLGGDGTNGAPYANPRVVAQWDFVGNAFNAESVERLRNTTLLPFRNAFADDCNGHGTHVSGIVGAKTAGSENRCRSRASRSGIPGLRVRRLYDGGHHDRRHGAGTRRRHGHSQHVHRLRPSTTWPQYPTAAASDNPGEEGHDGRRIDRQQRRRRRVLGGSPWASATTLSARPRSTTRS